MIEINGENGGGQILRSALSLSMITGQGFRMKNIRGKRSKPGLMRQHLTCVKAAAEISSAELNKGNGAEMHDEELQFLPGKVNAGEYVFRIGSAGSTTLLFQTLLPALMFAGDVSSIEIHGGTHNPMAPTADFIKQAFLPQIKKMGAEVSFECLKYGFAPSGSGCIKAKINPVKRLKRISLLERGEVISRKAQCILSNVSKSVGERELSAIQSALAWGDEELELKVENDVDGAGNVLSLEEVYDNVVIHASCCGMKAKSAERVARDAMKHYLTFVNSSAAVDGKLADQLLLPMALSGLGGFSTIAMTNHIRTNVDLIKKFCDVEFDFKDDQRGLLKVVLSSKIEI